MSDTIAADVDEHRQDALGPLLAISGGGWLSVFVGALVYHDITRTAWRPLPFLATLVLLLGAAYAQRRSQKLWAARLLVAALLAGPLVFGLAYGLHQAALFCFIFPIIVAGVLLTPAAVWPISGIALGGMLLTALLGEPRGGIGAYVSALWLTLLPAVACLTVAAVVAFHALATEALMHWAIDSQRKDARRAELFRQQQVELQAANTELGRANEQLQVLNAQLAEARRVADTANQLKTRFLANVSHELRAPLQVMLGVADAALTSPTVAQLPQIARDFQHVQQSGRHLSRLINDLLDLSRAEIDALELYPETTDAHTLLADLFGGVAAGQEPGGAVVWQLELPPRLPLIQADQVRLRQILFNLLSNAAKYTASGTITLGAAAEPPYLHIWVADTGSGIPIDQQERIFEPFGSRHGHGRPPGVGLGLSITRRLVALHHGLLTLESQPGAGSTFHAYLPLPDTQGQPASLPPGAQPVLLLLSEAAELAPEIAAVVQRQRLPLRRPATVEALTALLRTEQPVGLIWDLNHAAAAHWPIVEQLRANPALCGLPLLLFGQDQGPLPDLTMGVTEFVLKPLSTSGLLERVAAIQPAASGPILIVDDDPQARQSYRALLAQALPQHAVVEAADGAAALALLETLRPSLVVLDLTMPAVDGFTVLEELRASRATQQTPVIVLSGRLLAREDVERLRYAHVTFQSKETLQPAELAAHTARVLRGEQTLAPATSNVVKQAIAYLHQHYAEPFSRQALAGDVGMSERYLTEIFHQEVGLSPLEYLNRLRVVQAQQLLRTSSQSIAAIAEQVGFEDARYFARVFRRVTGVPPSEYREQPGALSIREERVVRDS